MIDALFPAAEAFEASLSDKDGSLKQALENAAEKAKAVSPSVMTTQSKYNDQIYTHAYQNANDAHNTPGC